MTNTPLFFVVGAQKTGTTSLYKYLSAHPDIHMPIEKETPFFDASDIDKFAWEEYQKKYLTTTREQMIAGTATPQYMCDYRIPGRIAEYAPNAKIIIILRDPIERAVSHYKMMVRRGIEHRSFEAAIKEQILPECLKQEREKTYEEIMKNGEHNSYVCRGEYKRIVDLYHQHFPVAVMVICSRSLRDNRRKTVEDVLQFLGVRSSILPNTLMNVYHKSDAGSTEKVKKWIAQSKSIRLLAKIFVPKSLSRYVWNKYLKYLGGDVKNVTIDARLYQRLVKHYRETNLNLGGCMDGWFDTKPSEDGDYSL